MALDLLPALDLVRAYRENPAQPEIRAELSRRVARDGGRWCVGDAIYTTEADDLVVTPVHRDPTRRVPSAVNRGKYLDSLPRGKPHAKAYRQARSRRL